MKNTIIYELLKSRGSNFIGNINAIIPKIKIRLQAQVPKIFPQFTLHDIMHSKRVLEYIPGIVNDINSFNDLELALMFYAALLHDIGMALGTDDIERIKTNDFGLIHDFSVFEKLYGENAISEIIRQNHAHISAKILLTHPDLAQLFILEDPLGVSFLEDVALLCESHTKDNLWLGENLKCKNIKGKYDYNLRYISHVLRIADLLDIDQSRTPFELYTLINPKGTANDEWKQHFIVTNTKKIEENVKTGRKDIVFYGQSDNIRVHRKLLTYIKWLNCELMDFKEFCSNQDVKKYSENLSSHVVTNIETKGFTISDYKLSLDFSSITELLMGENIYGDKKLGLREIIQNSIDACLVRKEIEKLSVRPYVPAIHLVLNKEENKFSISDNGIGMSEEIIKKYFLNIGKSYYKSDLFKLNDLDYKPIGSFGIGFLSCFMLSEDVVIKTRYYKNSNKHIIQLERGDEFISFNTVSDVVFEGTEITLNLQQVIKEFGKKPEEIISFIKKYFVNDDYDIVIIINNKSESICNSISTLPIEKKNFITDDVSNYIEDASGYIALKNTHKFIKNANDLNDINDNIYFIEEGTFKKFKFDLKKLIDPESNELKYIQLPLFFGHKRPDFDKALELLDDDIDAVIQKIEQDDSAYLFYNQSNQGSLEEDAIYNEDDFVLYEEDVCLSDIIKDLGQNYFCPKTILRKILICKDMNIDLLEEYRSVNLSQYSWRNPYDFQSKLYLRNILVTDHSFTNEFIAQTIELVGYSINVYKKDIIPNISRNQLLPVSKEILNNTINLSLHLMAIENFSLETAELEIMKTYIKRQLLTKPHFVKNEMLNKHNL